ncbi:anti-anti-sigma factor [Amycolatopsis pretoriensis]|uniref:Anti-anti-sigma factor n=1 Tax=Amycolatopsis pretoriensis TaxID=218821 RepID=A0A1H5RJU6_9PSEU|nr:STAS domain-containing protein [Amycolatopsis pretoriensis]SEF37761.1 anti-anti-sigma factor [Amycolatopsis pretoriensis]
MDTSSNHVTVTKRLTVAVTVTATGHAVVTVAGELDAATTARFADCLGGTLHPSCGAVVVDLSGVTFCAAAGLRALLNFTGEARVRGVPVAVVADHTAVTRPVQVLQLTQALSLHERLPDALAWLAVPPCPAGSGPHRPAS